MAALLARRHERDRAAMPELTSRWAEVDAAADLLTRSCIDPGGDGAVAERDGEVVGFLFGVRSLVDPSSFLAQYAPPRGINMPVSGHAIAEGEDAYSVYAALYGALAEEWVQRGFLEHRAGIVTADPAMEQAWFRLGFGSLHTFAFRDLAPVEIDEGSVHAEVRRPSSEDRAEVGRFEDLNARFHREAPIFWPYLGPDVERAVEDFDRHILAGEENAALLAYAGGEAVGMNLLVGQAGFGPEMCSPEGSVYLYEGIVEAGRRGGGIGSALFARSVEWAREQGYRWVTLHWGSPNQSGAAFWTGHGFRVVEMTVQRRLDERLTWARPEEDAEGPRSTVSRAW